MKYGVVHISDLIGDRFDVQFSLGKANYSKTKKKIPYKSLGEIVQFSSETWNQKTIFNDVFPYIEIGSINTTTGEINNIDLVRTKEAPSRAKKIVRNKDILVSTTRPNRGAICLYDKEKICVASTGFSIIREVNDDILRDFLFLVLRLPLSLDQMMKRSSGGNYPAIIESELKKILIPIPSLSVQSAIVDVYAKAFNARLCMIKEAKRLLDSIDDYILEILRINCGHSEIKGEKAFVKNISSLIGNRLDVSFYKDKFEMKSIIYQNEKLSSLVDIDPSVKFTNLNPDMLISFIPMENIDEKYGDVSELKETTISKTKGYTKFEENDLLWAKITPCMQNGKSAIARNLKNGLGCGSTEYYVMRPKNNHILIDYIYLILRHHEVLKAAQSSFGGSAGQQRVSSQYLKSIVIPNPDIAVQKEIVKTVYAMKNKAKQLQKEGNALLEETKKQIEKMIIG